MVPVLAFLLVAVPGCGGGEAEVDVMADVPVENDVPMETDGGVDSWVVPPGTVRFIHISDTHVHGWPEDPHADHLETAVTQLNGLDFDADFVVVTGDVVDFLPDEYLDPALPGTLHVALQTLDGLKWPYYAINGNHEYYLDGNLNPTLQKEARDQFLADMFGGGGRGLLG